MNKSINFTVTLPSLTSPKLKVLVVIFFYAIEAIVCLVDYTPSGFHLPKTRKRKLPKMVKDKFGGTKYDLCNATQMSTVATSLIQC